MLRFFIAQTMIFGTIDDAINNLKIIISAMENLRIPLDRAHRVVHGRRIATLEHVPRRIAARITLMVAHFRWKMTVL